MYNVHSNYSMINDLEKYCIVILLFNWKQINIIINYFYENTYFLSIYSKCRYDN